MYETFYRLRAKPFTLLPDPGFLFLGIRHRTGLSHLEYGLLNRAVFTVLTGEPGTGKTTLLNKILDQNRDRYLVGVIATTHPDASSLLPWVADAFGMESEGQDTVGHFRALAAFLAQAFARGQHVLLIVDEAQNLNAQMLEDLRLLSNINDGRQGGVQIILAGQPSLRALLTRHDMRQLAQRIAVDYALEPLNEEETRAYIDHRLRVAGDVQDLFSDYACTLVHRLSGGIPRLINQLCDLALTYGFAEGASRITAALLLQAATDRARGGILPAMDDPATMVLDPAEVAREGLAPPQASGTSAPAVQTLSNASATRPTDAAEYYRKGLGLKQKGMYRDAMSKFEAAAKDSAYRFKASVQRGLCLKAIGRLDDAASAFRHALAVNSAPVSDVMHVRYVLGLTLDGLGLPDEARDQFEAIHAVDPAFRDIADRLERGTGFPHSRLAWIKSLRRSWQQFRGVSV